MPGLDELRGFRDRENLASVAGQIRQIARGMGSLRIMHVCGTHEDTVSRFGLREILPANIKIVSGPGCPVCVTTPAEIDMAISLVRKGITVTSFGDMLKVPGSEASLETVRPEGEVKVVYSISDSVALAKQNPGKEVTHIAIGFETTAPSTAAELLSAPPNFSVLCCHRLIPPAMAALLDENVRIDGFIDPGHVSAIIGSNAYDFISQRYKVPQVVAGFEPLDVLLAVRLLVQMIRGKDPEVRNEYSRVVRSEGNVKALGIMGRAFTPTDMEWRGLGKIPASGLKLKDEFAGFDAERKYGLERIQGHYPAGCRCGDVLKGIASPEDCILFGKKCIPLNPVGPCMVSAEGSCAIHYRHRSLS